MNNIKLSGEIITLPEFSHEENGEKFYKFFVRCIRLSGTLDILPCVVPYKILDEITEKSFNGLISLYGEIRTRNEHWGKKNKLIIYVFVKQVETYCGFDENFVKAHGYLCKETTCRKTPLGRDIADLVLASIRERIGTSDYIPCIAWGRNALRAEYITVGSRLMLEGRLQSRNYIKKFDDGTEEVRTAYEVSASRIDVVGKWGKEDENKD